MSSPCDSIDRLSLGAYVLGALDPVERAELEEHLADCRGCREELAALAGLPGLLSRVSVEEVLEPLPSPTPAMTNRLILRLRAARRARRRRIAAAVGAAALAAATVGAVLLANGPSKTEPAVASVSAKSPRTGVAATMQLRPAEWGTAVRVSLKGVPPKTRCRLIAYARDGHREVAGTWSATYAGTAEVDTATAIPKRELRSLEITTSTGRRLVRAALE